MPAGRPPKYKSPDEMQEKIDEYFQHVEDTEDIPIVEDLALFLGFCGRQVLFQYEEKEEFTDTIKRAKSKILSFWVKKSAQNELNPAITIFNLKNNFGYEDRKTQQHEGGENPIKTESGVSPAVAAMLEEVKKRKPK